MKKVLIAMVLITGCGPSDPSARDMAAANSAQSGAGEASSYGGLTGLYEGGPGARPSQLCIVEPKDGNAQFGLVVWGANMHNCSGAGEAEEKGKDLRLTMAGDQICTVTARLENGVITLPENVAEGCAYYCGARARLAGATFTKKGDRLEDAMKARDLVGEPLCGGLAAAP